MLFVVNELTLHGGTTFLIRMCRSLSNKGMRGGVLILYNNIDKRILFELKEIADVYFLSDFSYSPIKFLYSSPLSIFMPFKKKCLANTFLKYENNIHIFGVLGLLFVQRLIGEFNVKISVGVYHQNEFMYSGINEYFSNKAQEIFKSLNDKSIIFFNETNKKSYSKFFNNNYEKSVILPIGIDDKSERLGEFNSFKIVSIGNLEKFKTYNKHVIELMPELLTYNSDITYEIYGKGNQFEELKKLVIANGISDKVLFKGRVDYKSLDLALTGAHAFVGSGTAVLEAAIIGIPSIIGIESSELPITYGYLNEINGFSYNERSIGYEEFHIQDKILSLMNSEEHWKDVSNKCIVKAKEFTIENTVFGFVDIFNSLEDSSKYKHTNYNNVLSLLSVVKHIAFSKVFKTNNFLERRNQGNNS